MADPVLQKEEKNPLAVLESLLPEKSAGQPDGAAEQAANLEVLGQKIEAQGVEDAARAEVLSAEIKASAPPEVDNQPKPKLEGPLLSSEVPQLTTVRMEVPEALAKA